MSVRLYHDEHVRAAVTEGLRRRGVDVLTAQEDGAEGTPDPALLDRATVLGRVVFTQDEDFLVEAHLRQHSANLLPVSYTPINLRSPSVNAFMSWN